MDALKVETPLNNWMNLRIQYYMPNYSPKTLEMLWATKGNFMELTGAVLAASMAINAMNPIAGTTLVSTATITSPVASQT